MKAATINATKRAAIKSDLEREDLRREATLGLEDYLAAIDGLSPETMRNLYAWNRRPGGRYDELYTGTQRR